jgi:uncharacterized protein
MCSTMGNNKSKALITGATSGIGYEMAKILAGKGYDLILASRNMDKMEEIAKELSRLSNVFYYESDLSEQSSAQNLYDRISGDSHEVEILINNSGFGMFGPHVDGSADRFEKMTTLNITSLTVLCNLFGQNMVQKRKGYILNVASTAAYQPLPYFAAYSASKSYVRNFSRALHYELARHNVSVTCLSPGPTKTNFFDVAEVKEHNIFSNEALYMTALQVAEIGINAMFEGKPTIVAGNLNKLSSLIGPFTPLSLMEKFINPQK